ncbi:MAG: leucine-rich repeat protein [Prevotella sp.]|nr:leucine-rich repeat protein [Prevotella sp.]
MKLLTFKRAALRTLAMMTLAMAAGSAMAQEAETPVYFEDEATGVCFKVTDAEAKEVAVTTIDNVTWAEMTTAYNGYQGAVVIPATVTYGDVTYRVTSVREYAFAVKSNMKAAVTSVQLPESVATLGNNAFHNCAKLTSVNIPAAVTALPDNVFNNCKVLTGVELPDGLTSIGMSAFSGCVRLAALHIPESVTQIGTNAFNGCSKLASVNIPAGVTRIEGATFMYCTSLVEFPWHDGITYIGQNAFNGCSGIKEFSLPNNDKITSIASSVFQGCTGLTKIEIPERITSIAGSAFRNCDNVTTIVLPSTLSSLDTYSFGMLQNHNLTDVYVGSTTPPSFSGAGFSGYDYQVFGYADFSDPYKHHRNVTLHVPAGTAEAYKTADIWKYFAEYGQIVEPIVDDHATVNMAARYATFCCSSALDFSQTTGVKAYVASAFDPESGTLSVARVDKVPATTGLLLIADSDDGGEFTIPYTEKAAYCVSLLKGLTISRELPTTEGAYTNFILADGNNGIGFYRSSGGTLAAGKAYLPLPSELFQDSAAARSLTIVVDNEPTAIRDHQAEGGKDDGRWYSLSGTALKERPAKAGVYVHGGKKVIVK